MTTRDPAIGGLRRRRVALAVLGVLGAGLCAAPAVHADDWAERVDQEFRVSKSTTGDQLAASIALSAGGELVVAWEGEGPDDASGIYYKRYNVSGGPLTLELLGNNHTTGNQRNPAVAMDADGDFVVVWESDGQDGDGYGVYARRFNAAGKPRTPEVLVNERTTGAQRYPAVAVDGGGDFVVVWESDDQDGDGYGIFAQRFGADGVKRGGEFRVNSYTLGDQGAAAVAMDANGDFVVAWQSAGQDGSLHGIYARRYDRLGNPLGDELQVNHVTLLRQVSPSVAMDADGDFVVAWQSFLQDGDGYGIFARRFDPAGAAMGNDILVNQYVTGDQTDPRVAMDADGDFVVAWDSDGQDASLGIYARRFQADRSPLTDELRVHSYPTGNKQLPAVGTDADGDFVVAWESDGQDGDGLGVYAQRYFGSGAPAGGEFQVNTYTAGAQWNPALAMDADGEFVAVWDSFGQDGSEEGIYAQRYWADGGLRGVEERVSSHTVGEQAYPVAAMDADGDFVVVWRSDGQDGDSFGVYAQRYAAGGAAAGPEVRVNTYTTGSQTSPAVAMDAGGDFVVAWQSSLQDGNGWGVFARRYVADGTPAGGELPVNVNTAGAQTTPDVAMDADGDFVVAWASQTGDGNGYGVYARLYAASGTPAPGEIQVNQYTTGDQKAPSVAMAADGDFVVVWHSDGQDGSDDGVFARRFDAGGAPLGDEVRANTYTANGQRSPSVAMDVDGGFVVAWDSDGQDGDYLGVFAQRFDEAASRIGGEFQVNSHTTLAQSEPSVAASADGDFVVAWQSGGNQDGNSSGVFARRYQGGGCYGEPVWLHASGVQSGGWLDCVSYSRIDAGPGVVVNAGGTLVLTSPATAMAPGFRVVVGGVLKAGP